MPLHDAVGVNSKMDATTKNQGADVKYMGKGVIMIVIVCVIRFDTPLWWREKVVVYYYYNPMPRVMVDDFSFLDCSSVFYFFKFNFIVLFPYLKNTTKLCLLLLLRDFFCFPCRRSLLSILTPYFLPSSVSFPYFILRFPCTRFWENSRA